MSRAGAAFTPRLVLVRVIGRGAVLRLASAVGDGLAWGLVMVLSILDEGWNSGMEIFAKFFQTWSRGTYIHPAQSTAPGSGSCLTSVNKESLRSMSKCELFSPASQARRTQTSTLITIVYHSIIHAVLGARSVALTC